MTRGDVKYQWAEDGNGKLHYAADLREAGDFNRESLFCVGCKRQLTAKVHGEIKRPHFAHRANEPCPLNYYLEQLTKKVFAESFTACVNSGESFVVNVRTTVVCYRYASIFSCPCVVQSNATIPLDLPRHYETADLHSEGEGFPSTLRLCPLAESKARPLFVEVEVHDAHFRARSFDHDAPTLVLHIRDEADVYRIRLGDLPANALETINFQPKPIAANDTECVCAGGLFCAVIREATGQTYCDSGTISELQRRFSRPLQNCHHDFQPIKRRSDTKTQMFSSLINLMRRGIDVKNCHLCEFQRESRSPNFSTIYCRMLNKPCSWNAANDCEHFTIKSVVKHLAERRG
jgi:hypothetical protein